LVVGGDLEMDGVLHRVRVEGDHRGERSGAYVGYLDGHPAGLIQNDKTGLKTNWKSANPVQSLNDIDRQRLQQEAAEGRADRLRRRNEEQETIAGRAQWQLSNTAFAPYDHPYHRAKGIADKQHDLRQDRHGNLPGACARHRREGMELAANQRRGRQMVFERGPSGRLSRLADRHAPRTQKQ
jgi:phage/plasmid primase-like uncharacterized protein